MKRPSRISAILISALLAISVFSGCNADTTTTAIQAASSTQVTAAAEPVKASYDSEDLDAAWSAAESTLITLKEGTAAVSGSGAEVSDSKVTITKAGTYVLAGTLSNGQVIINAGEEDMVRLVLNGVSITNTGGPAIYGMQAEKVIITLAAGTSNTVTDGTTYILAADEDEPNAAVFSKTDISINGPGELTVNGKYNHGIFSKDDLVIADGTLVVTAVNDGLKGKDSVAVKNGQLTITAGSDGIQTSNADERDKGWMCIDGGSITITAGDDGLHAESSLYVGDGSILIMKSLEGIEGKTITLAGGKIDVTASDDALNATSGSTTEGAEGPQSTDSSVFIRITGGTVAIDSQGDGIDSNGSLYLEGGVVRVNGPTNNGNGALDYNGECILTGGTLTIAGSSGMAQSPGTTSTQASITVIYNSLQKAGTPATLTDSTGKVILSFTPEKDYQSMVFSSPELKQGASYTLYSGGTKLTDIKLESMVTRIADDGSTPAEHMGGPGSGGPRPEGVKPGTRPTKPDTTQTPSQ